MFTELVEYCRKVDEKMKAIESEIKENEQGTKSEGKETTTQRNDLEQKEEVNIQPEQNKKITQKKMWRGLGTSETTLNVPTSESQG